MVVEYTESCLVVINFFKKPLDSKGVSHLLTENIFFDLVVPENKIFYAALNGK